jgi:hypothetical protein
MGAGNHVRRSYLAPVASIAAVLAAATIGFGGPLTDRGTQPGPAYPLLGSSSCAGCHANYDAAEHIEPWNTWSGSMMAQASRDPLFWAALDVANNDVPGAGAFCLRCHVSRGWLAGRAEPPGGGTDGCDLQGNIDQAGNDFDGVNCHLCHRMMINESPPAGEAAAYSENAQFWLDDSDCDGAGEPCRRGPYDYPDGPQAPHAWAYSFFHVESELCGTCHNVTSPVNNLVEDGTDTGIPFPIERTFREWQQSDYAPGGPDFEPCQGCHMPDAVAEPSHASSHLLYDRSGDMAVHQFAGGNAWIPEVLRGEYPGLGIDASLVATRDWALDMLQNRSATVELTLDPSAVAGGTLDAEVRVTNLTGHKLPTGYPEGRRMWIALEARDGSGNPLWQSGAYDPLTGVLSEDPQIKVYHAEAGIWNHNGDERCDTVDGTGLPMFHFVRNDCYAVDNRIPPKGFWGGSDPSTRPRNYEYPELMPGTGLLVNYDLTSYTIPVPAGTTGPLTVTATLRYQTASKEYVEFLLRESDSEGFADDCIPRSSGPPGMTRGEILHDAWSRYDRSPPVDMGTATAESAVLPPTPGEASGPAGSAMRVTGHDPGAGSVTVSYEPACGATDHTVYFGNLAELAAGAYSGSSCGHGTSGSATFAPGAGDVYWIVVASDGTVEGSYGRDSGGSERPEDTQPSACNLPQDLGGSCD